MMRLTEAQQAALAQAHATCPPRGNSAIHYFLAGIECERARAAKVCRELEEQRRGEGNEICAQASRECAEGIEQST